MNAYQYAMRMEVQAEKYYRELGEASSDTTIKAVFEMLADEEKKHFKLFETMSKSQELPDMIDVDMSGAIKQVFKDIKTCNRRYSFTDDQVEYYEKAAKLEDDAAAFYREKAAEMTDPKQEAVFLAIAKEEDKHKILMENLANFVAAPDTWLESAEFYSLVKED